MSAVSETLTVLVPPGGRTAGSREMRSPARSQPAVRLAAFGALGLYGALRWSSLLSPRPTGRLLALLAVSALAAGGLHALARRGSAGRAIAALGAVAVVIAGLALSGVPTTLITHAHIHTIAAGIGQGLAALPRVTVPYGGIDAWARIVVLLGAAVLLLDAAMLLAFAPAELGDAWRAAAALPLIALAVVPSTLMAPSVPYLHGLLLLGLVAALVWGERLERRGLATAVVVTGAAGGIALAAAPAFDNHHPWLNYASLAGAFSPSHVETFDWTQRYGPLRWPRTGREMLDVQAPTADYWKAENLDAFNGVGWVQGAAETGNLVPAPDPSAAARWTQTVRVTIRGMVTSEVIAAGYAAAPRDVPVGSAQGVSPGTWAALASLGPGDTYQVSTYSPRPTDAELAAVGEQDPYNLLAGYRSISLPASNAAPYIQPQVVFPPFHSTELVSNITGVSVGGGAAIVASSPYRRAYALAQTLARRSRTPVAYVQSVERYLAHGFTYGERPPPSKYPLESFLFRTKLGYCQQFAGAMALLLRMGGVPARVAAGFATGTRDTAAGDWVVSDLDAHAWVEAWFPHYGWVRFEPTPAAAPALGGHTPAVLAAAAQRRAGKIAQNNRRADFPGATASASRRGSSGSSAGFDVALALLVAVGALGLTLLARGARGSADPVAELERALARCGRPISPATTLAQLEQRFRSSPEAAGYVHALLLARYAGASAAPPPAGRRALRAGRRALRAQLAHGLGPSGRLRAMWALPPGPRRVR